MILYCTEPIHFQIVFSNFLNISFLYPLLTCFVKSFLRSKFETYYRSSVLKTHTAEIINLLFIICIKTCLIQHIKIKIRRSTLRNRKFIGCCI